MNTSPLSEREHAVFRHLAEGLTPQEIAARIGTAAGTVNKYLMRIRTKLDARTNEQAIIKAAWYHPHLLKGCMVKHGTLEALSWHEDRDVPPCPACQLILDAQQARVKVPRLPSRRAPGEPYRRLTPAEQHAKRGEPVAHGTMQMARRHIAAGHRIRNLECGCREAYREWYREYDRQRGVLDVA